MLRVADLCEEQRRAHLGERVPEAKNESTGHPHLEHYQSAILRLFLATSPGMMNHEILTSVAITGSRDDTANNHDDTAEHDGRLSAEEIGNIRSHEVGDDGADVKHVDHDTELVRIGTPLHLDGVPDEDLVHGAILNGKELFEPVHLLRRVGQHAVVASCG